MSKLYKKYLVLKETDSSKIYLFKSGIFYLFIADDAICVSEKLGLKLVNLNETVKKCGFPASNLSKYTNILENLNISYKIVDENLNVVSLKNDYIQNSEIINIIDSIKKLNLDNISPIQAFTILNNYHKKLIAKDEE